MIEDFWLYYSCNVFVCVFFFYIVALLQQAENTEIWMKFTKLFYRVRLTGRL